MGSSITCEWCTISAGNVTLTNAEKREGTRGGTFFLESFAICKYPITNNQFEVYLEQTSHEYEIIETAFKGNDLPRTNVSWFEAIRFCQWLSQSMNAEISLSTELQWQRAAQGDSSWLYPWGNDIDINRCNYDGYYKGVTSVTQFPEGASCFGVMDMSGNVFEWCLDKWGISYNGPLSQTVRGGSWNHGGYNARVTFRGRSNPNYGYINVGFRPVIVLDK